MRRFIPLHDRVLVLPEAAPVKVGGLAKAQSQEEEPTEGIVIAVGTEAGKQTAQIWNRKEERFEPLKEGGVAVGQRVVWAKYSGREVMHEGRKHRLLRLEELDGIIEESQEDENAQTHPAR